MVKLVDTLDLGPNLNKVGVQVPFLIIFIKKYIAQGQSNGLLIQGSWVQIPICLEFFKK